jgi:hypothetical protein
VRNVPRILHHNHQRQLLPALIAVSYMGVEELCFLVAEVVFEPGEEGGPGWAGANREGFWEDQLIAQVASIS